MKSTKVCMWYRYIFKVRQSDISKGKKRNKVKGNQCDRCPVGWLTKVLTSQEERERDNLSFASLKIKHRLRRFFLMLSRIVPMFRKTFIFWLSCSISINAICRFFIPFFFFFLLCFNLRRRTKGHWWYSTLWNTKERKQKNWSNFTSQLIFEERRGDFFWVRI